MSGEKENYHVSLSSTDFDELTENDMKLGQISGIDFEELANDASRIMEDLSLFEVPSREQFFTSGTPKRSDTTACEDFIQKRDLYLAQLNPKQPYGVHKTPIRCPKNDVDSYIATKGQQETNGSEKLKRANRSHSKSENYNKSGGRIGTVDAAEQQTIANSNNLSLSSWKNSPKRTSAGNRSDYVQDNLMSSLNDIPYAFSYNADIKSPPHAITYPLTQSLSGTAHSVTSRDGQVVANVLEKQPYPIRRLNANAVELNYNLNASNYISPSNHNQGSINEEMPMIKQYIPASATYEFKTSPVPRKSSATVFDRTYYGQFMIADVNNAKSEQFSQYSAYSGSQNNTNYQNTEYGDEVEDDIGSYTNGRAMYSETLLPYSITPMRPWGPSSAEKKVDALTKELEEEIENQPDGDYFDSFFGLLNLSCSSSWAKLF